MSIVLPSQINYSYKEKARKHHLHTQCNFCPQSCSQYFPLQMQFREKLYEMQDFRR